jgi:D-alanyl-D-alanine carboxypeptidase
MLALVNKTYELPSSYVPPDLANASAAIRPVRGTQTIRAVIMDPLRKMVDAMHSDGLDPAISSGYRSYDEQVATFNYWVTQYGQKEAERVSAKAGHSEHQLGTAIDFASPGNNYQLDDSFSTTKEGKWLAQKARDYGFILRYPNGKEGVTGYAYEPWHFRYVGDIAKEIEDQQLTLDEYLANRAR